MRLPLTIKPWRFLNLNSSIKITFLIAGWQMIRPDDVRYEEISAHVLRTEFRTVLPLAAANPPMDGRYSYESG